MKIPITTAALFAPAILSHAQMQQPIPLWPNGAPGAHGTSTNDVPTITPYLADPKKATGAAMVILPGGGYQHLAPHEGNDYALWLNQHGVTCFVVKYRLNAHGYQYPAEFQDGVRSMRWVRAHAKDYKIDADRIGIMGSSAGGHLASMVLTHFDDGDAKSADVVEQQSSRPDLGILCYAVISMGEFAHVGSKTNLLGVNPAPEMLKLVSSELQVKTNTPTCFIWCTFQDKTVPMENSLMFAEALRRNHVPFDLHIYENGRHGLGLADKPPFAHPHPWANDCLFWLKQHEFVKE